MVEYPSESWKQEQLQDALKSKDIMLKMGAIRVLQEKPRDDYVLSLVDALNDTDRLVRINAAISLGKIKNPIAVPALVYHAVSDHDKDVRLYSSWAYRQIDYAKASPQLVKVLLEGENDDMIRFAANEIRQKNDAKAVELLIQRFASKGFYTGYDLEMEAINGLYEIGYATVEPLVKCLDSEDTRVQSNSVYALGKIGDDRAIQPLINHLPVANVELRSRISDALIKIGRPSIPALVKLLESKDREVKWIAAYSMGQIGPEAEAALLAALKERGAQSSEEIIYALGIVGKKSSFAPIFNIYSSTADDSVRAWATIGLASVIAFNYNDIEDRKSSDRFLDDLGDQLKPHMMLSYEVLHALGKIYINRAIGAKADAFRTNVEMGVKCFDLSLIERDNAAAKAYRLFYGSYLKLMTSKSSEIMNYVERDVTDLKKEAERSTNKKEIVILMDRLLTILHSAYEDKNFDFIMHFDGYVGLCLSMEQFLNGFYDGEEPKKPVSKDIGALHADIGMIQDKLNALIKAFGSRDDTESIALAYRLSTEMEKIDTGLYEDYRVVESCLKNIVTRSKLSNEEKSDLHFKILLISKNGVSQIQLVLDQMLKGMNVSSETDKKELMVQKAVDKKPARKVSLIEYIAIVILVILIIAVIVLALNKFGIINLGYTFPISWLNPSLTAALEDMGLF